MMNDIIYIPEYCFKCKCLVEKDHEFVDETKGKEIVRCKNCDKICIDRRDKK